MRKVLLFLTILGLATTASAQNGMTLAAGSNTLKAIHFKGYPGLGLYSSSAGVMVLGDETGGFSCTSGSGCTTTGTFTLDRTNLTEDALQKYGIPISSLQQVTGIPLSASETEGNFNVSVAANVVVAKGEVTDIETETSVTQFQFVLPHEYVSGGDITIRLPVALIKSGAPTNDGSTIDVAVYKQTNNAVGSDLSTTTAAATFAALDTFYNKDFVITASGLVAGDVLNVVITAAVTDSEAGGGTIVLNLAPPSVLLDVKG